MNTEPERDDDETARYAERVSVFRSMNAALEKALKYAEFTQDEEITLRLMGKTLSVREDQSYYSGVHDVALHVQNEWGLAFQVCRMKVMERLTNEYIRDGVDPENIDARAAFNTLVSYLDNQQETERVNAEFRQRSL